MASVEKIERVERVETVVVQEEQFVLTLNPREAQIILALTAHCNDSDSKFPEVKDIHNSLRYSGVPDYFDRLSVVNQYADGQVVHYRLKNK